MYSGESNTEPLGPTTCSQVYYGNKETRFGGYLGQQPPDTTEWPHAGNRLFIMSERWGLSALESED